MRRLPSPGTWLLALLLVFAASGPAASLTLDPKPERAPVRLPGDLFGDKAPVEGLVRVKMAARKVKYSRVLETTPLAVSPPSGQTSGQASGVPDLALTTPEGSRDLAFGRFNEVALDLRDNDPENPTLAALTVRTPDGRTFASDPLECVERLGQAYLEDAAAPDRSVAVARTEWVDKNPLYLLRRFLDLPLDPDWRIAGDGPSTFLQRRFDRDALDLGAVDVILRRPAPVQVNLVLALDPDRPRARVVLDWYALAKRTFELPDGRTVLRVYVGRYLRERFPGLRTARLKEVSLMFFRQAPAEVARDRLTERLVFVPSGLDPADLAARGLPGRLPTRVREPFPGTRRVFVNISRLGGETGAATARLRLAPMAPGLPGGASVEGAALALVSPRRETPAFLAAADELASGLGAAPDIDRPDGGVTVTPVWSLASPFAGAPRRAGLADAPVPVFASGGQELFQGQGGVRLYRGPSGLVVEGQGPRLTVPMDAAFAPAAGTAYFLRLDIGHAPGLAGVFCDVFAPGAAQPAATYALRPGQPTPLPGLPASVARAALRFEFSGREFALPFSRAVLAAVPSGRPGEGLYAARLPWPVATAAKVATVPEDGTGTFRFVPTTPLGRFDWLTAHFALTGDPVAVAVDQGAPTLPDTRSGILAGRLRNQGTATLAVAGTGGKAPGELALSDPAFSGQALADWRTLFAAATVLDLGDRRFTPGLVAEDTARRLHEADDWLDLGRAELPVKAAQARFFEHPWETVSALCFETGQEIDLSRFAAPPRTPGGSGGPGTLGRVVLAAIVVLAALAGLRLAGRQRLARLAQGPTRWLATRPDTPAKARRELWLGLGAAAMLAASGLVLPAAAGRVALGLAAVALVPVWRVLAPAVTQRLARRAAPLGAWLAADPGRPYFLGFALALALAAGLRSLGLVRPSEFVVQAGLSCFLAGCYLQIAPRQDDAGPAGATDTVRPKNPAT